MYIHTYIYIYIYIKQNTYERQESLQNVADSYFNVELNTIFASSLVFRRHQPGGGAYATHRRTTQYYSPIVKKVVKVTMLLLRTLIR